jgi:integrin alpha 7
MSVTVGDFFGSGLAYAAGAPRSNGTGQVILFTRHFQKPLMEVTLTLNGEQFASSFGYELASADVNGDKYEAFTLIYCYSQARLAARIRP